MSDSREPNRWLVHGHCPQRRLRLYCFSHAGGDASTFHPWQSVLGPEVQVCGVRLPGRGARFCETPCTSLQAPVVAVAEAIAADSALPFWFLGHSMGALMAYEVARYLAAHDMPRPAGLLASGCEAPTRLRPKRLRTAMDDDALIDALGRFNGVPPEVLQHRELMKLMLPTLRADLTMVETYTHVPGPPLGMPVEVLAGTADPLVEHDGLEGWAETTTGSCRTHWFEGDHFFINSQRQAVLQRVRQCMLPIACPAECIDA